MTNHTSKKTASQGFTIVELLIATAVFSVVLMAAIIGFTQVGKIFYKSVEIGKTQTAASNILDSVSNDLRGLADSDDPPDYNHVFVTGDNTAGWVCIGQHRYTYFLTQTRPGSIVNATDPIGASTTVGLIRDDLGGSVNCATHGTGPNFGYPSNLTWGANSQQMLGDGMSLGEFFINPINASFPSLYAAKIQVGFGPNNTGGSFGGVFDPNAPTIPDAGKPGAGNTGSPGTPLLRCRSLLGTNFCSVSSVNTYLTRGIRLQ